MEHVKVYYQRGRFGGLARESRPLGVGQRVNWTGPSNSHVVRR